MRAIFEAILLIFMPLGDLQNGGQVAALEINPTVIEKDGSVAVLINVRNALHGRSIDHLKISMRQEGGIVEEAIVGSLLPNQQRSIYLKSSGSVNSASWVYASYDVEGVNSTTHVTFGAVEKKINPLLTGPSPGVLGLVGVLVGGWLAHLFSAIRDKARSRVEWNKLMFDKYEQAYRDFLSGWNSAPSPELLKLHLGTLQSRALVPSELLDVGKQVLKTLQSAKPVDEKAAECRRFRNAVVDYILKMGG